MHCQNSIMLKMWAQFANDCRRHITQDVISEFSTAPGSVWIHFQLAHAWDTRTWPPHAFHVPFASSSHIAIQKLVLWEHCSGKHPKGISLPPIRKENNILLGDPPMAVVLIPLGIPCSLSSGRGRGGGRGKTYSCLDEGRELDEGLPGSNYRVRGTYNYTQG